jgi:crotonobetainyl-CoA:carnitine CoA-transferase CaiB-like acyl-CoA transferase
MAIMPYTTQQWTRFLECIDRTDLLAAEWVADPVRRSANVDTLYQLIADVAPSRTTAEWLQILDARDIPCGRANTLNDVFDEPHLKAAALFQDYTHPSEGDLHGVRSAFRVTGLECKLDRPAPRVGADSESVLEQAGYDQEAIKALIAQSIVRGSGG